ncbi:hypothetical protein CVD25_01115 [Bacillus canaveralius]|uniref:Uncharacterized protein n=1 Tax=Bacillus canaveralius TaxID=1403243 RepID=A0A2N5GPM5_9BACI|nr:hypothetical protein [Bacillus canaveralius]PLR84664.1 hypothetical protein CU635_06225 [Bacillus canaveralius]PLS00816.1 hypothetical protein CVD25_01115 [Bacillus canaveralius]
MITEHVVQGSKETSLHNFELTFDGLEIVVSPGEFYQAGEVVISTEEETLLTVDGPMHYEVWISKEGIRLYSYTDEQGYVIVPNPVDRLAWFSLAANQNLNETDIHVLKVVG